MPSIIGVAKTLMIAHGKLVSGVSAASAAAQVCSTTSRQMTLQIQELLVARTPGLCTYWTAQDP
eukprot:1503146-Amphidinium_carterae.1